MAIRDWPEGERPREKLLTLGARALSDAELLAIFLRTVERMEEVNHAAIRSVVEHIPDEWEDDQDYLPAAQTVRDWRWLRRAWRWVVIEGQDGLDLVWQ